jgi:hypothetical protein
MSNRRETMVLPMELTTAVRAEPKLPTELMQQLTVDAVARDRVEMIWRQAAFAGALADHAALCVDTLLRSPELLVLAANAAASGRPLTAAKIGLDADGVLASLGRVLAR